MRRFARITDRDGGNPWWIPQGERVETYGYGFRTSIQEVIGSDGGFDVHGDFSAPREVGRASIRFQLVADCPQNLEARIAEMMKRVEGELKADGLRKLWRLDFGSDSDFRFTWARALSRPRITRDITNLRHTSVRLELVCPDPLFYEVLSKRYLTEKGFTIATIAAANAGEPIAPDFDFADIDVTSSPTNFTIENRGDIESRRVIFRLESNSGAGFTNPAITNNTSGHTFSTTRDASAATDVLTINASPGLGRAQYSSDDGATFADDTDLLSLGVTQAELMVLQPGDNSMTITDGGTTNFQLRVWWLHSFREP